MGCQFIMDPVLRRKITSSTRESGAGVSWRGWAWHAWSESGPEMGNVRRRIHTHSLFQVRGASHVGMASHIRVQLDQRGRWRLREGMRVRPHRVGLIEVTPPGARASGVSRLPGCSPLGRLCNGQCSEQGGWLAFCRC
jgi:hypothetical protein